jgi:hypothetical protein
LFPLPFKSEFVGILQALALVKLDSSVYRADQPIFGPLQNADVMRYHGDPVDVDAVLATTPPAPGHERSTTADPYRALLIERGLLLRELGPGKDAITCPFARDHSEVTSDTSTVYLWPHHGGYKWGHIHCSHTHCAERKDEDYTRELGVELRDVWRRQAGAAPYDDLPPVEAYDDAAQEDARQHTAGAKAPGGDETWSGNGASPAGVCGGGEASMASEDSPRPFPVLSEAAWYGVFKEIVELGTRKSEADPAAVLMTALTFAAATIGTEPHMWVGDTRHHARLYSVLVGASSRARKGTSRDPVERIFRAAQLRRMPQLPFPLGNDLAITPGPLSSGEGLVYAVRDASDALDDDGQPIDPGVEDKRLLVVDGEFGAALKAAQRQGNTLSAILRSGWDHGNIAPLTKSNRIKASGAHINFVAHITLEELHALLESVDLWNGFANRILWAAVRRTGEVPHPSRIPDKDLGEVAGKVATALLAASQRGEMPFTPKAAALWTGIYPDLTQEHSGAFRAVTSRGEAQVRRIALLHAAFDTEASAIDVPHLEAAIAAWNYCLASARYVFGGAEADPEANKLLAALRERDMTLTDINGLFSGHKSRGAINALLTRLQSAGRVTLREEGGGRDGRAKTTVTLRK